ncbi:MAG TPA: exodeoxyribonuclease VII large subunit [Blastocatellia bacterium]|nr:exodeoxyribonuclease VII large subunit [Blastocatellia bacterium]
MEENLRRARFRLDGAGHRLTATDFRAPLAVKAARLENLERRTHQAIRRTLEQRQHRLALVGGKLSLLSPLSVLGRGYALAKDEAGRLIPRAADLMQEQTFRLLFEDGEIGCRVIEPTHKTYGKT